MELTERRKKIYFIFADQIGINKMTVQCAKGKKDTQKV